ncbi:hypothetical protein JYG23_11665 [Sedimentibacter sp. zth1]|uniref:hypothetical protein n=1 Tax=Sedimentibacter sp. zth1 TaxID=2816908 RepID=UPI001A91482F|nr:hypothetical protein [Sedimentibacter sp. zth1]QSX05327.1 hypothetical protein JYG23_11665 [Sedimentibacter sp. zth1]
MYNKERKKKKKEGYVMKKFKVLLITFTLLMLSFVCAEACNLPPQEVDQSIASIGSPVISPDCNLPPQEVDQ